MVRITGSALVLLGAMFVARDADAQDAGRGSVIAKVTNQETGAPLSDVLVRLPELNVGSLTDSVGMARFRNVPAGRFAVEARRVGYAPATAVLRVLEADSVKIGLSMRQTTIRLSPMTITEAATPIPLREFERRRRAGTGRYITEAQIDQSFGSDLNGLLSKRLPGLRATNTVFNGRAPGGKCSLVAYLDGIHLPNDVVNDIDPSQLAGVEYYTMTTIPVQYKLPGANVPQMPSGGGQLHCGMILFWSKAR